MKKITLLSLTLILLANCTLGPTQQNLPPAFEATGTQGLVITPNSASQTNIIMCQSANLIIDIHNNGVFDIPDGIYTTIAEEQHLTLEKGTKQKSFTIEGRSAYNPQGGIAQATFKLRNSGLPEQVDTYNTPFIFQTCYPYATHAAAPVCIDPDISNLNPNKVCKTTPVSLSGGQGAPIAVTLVEPRMIPEENTITPTFIIHIQNVGAGRVLSLDSFSSACGGAERKKLASTVRVSAELQDEQLSCSPEELTLDQDDPKILCQSTHAHPLSEGTYSSLLNINLDYGYTTTASIPLTINRLPGQKPCS